jgi:hypothetical protein
MHTDPTFKIDALVTVLFPRTFFDDSIKYKQNNSCVLTFHAKLKCPKIFFLFFEKSYINFKEEISFRKTLLSFNCFIEDIFFYTGFHFIFIEIK